MEHTPPLQPIPVNFKTPQQAMQFFTNPFDVLYEELCTNLEAFTVKEEKKIEQLTEERERLTKNIQDKNRDIRVDKEPLKRRIYFIGLEINRQRNKIAEIKKVLGQRLQLTATLKSEGVPNSVIRERVHALAWPVEDSPDAWSQN